MIEPQTWTDLDWNTLEVHEVAKQAFRSAWLVCQSRDRACSTKMQHLIRRLGREGVICLYQVSELLVRVLIVA